MLARRLRESCTRRSKRPEATTRFCSNRDCSSSRILTGLFPQVKCIERRKWLAGLIEQRLIPISPDVKRARRHSLGIPPHEPDRLMLGRALEDGIEILDKLLLTFTCL